MNEATRTITFQGNTLTLVGEEVNIGDDAPDFEVLANDLTPVTFESVKDKVNVIVTVPSLDTPVCDLETKRFNQEAAALGDDVQVLCVSMDLPFAQARWCGAAGIENVRTVSDHRDASFGTAYGVLIKELRLLARAIFIIDKEGKIRYVQLVDELTNEPDYDDVLNDVKHIQSR